MIISEYDELGRCTGTEIIVVICSPSPEGSTDPTTSREYKLYCTSCKSKLFFEDEGLYELRCKGCDAIAGIKDLSNDELC